MKPAFIRTRFTWQNYSMLAYFAFFQASLGLVMPFLRAELSLNYTLAGIHITASSIGAIIAGMVSERFIQRWSSRAVMWGSSSGLMVGLTLLTVGSHPTITILGAGIMGLLGSGLLIAIQAYLAQEHPHHQATALSEANVNASIGATLAPFLIGNLENIGLGWRLVLPGGVMMLLIIMLSFNTQRHFQKATEQTANPNARKLPLLFWIYALVLFLTVSIEWSVVFWGATFFEDVVGFSKANASLVMTTFFMAFIISRFVGSRLTLLFNSSTLLLASLGIVLIGFPLFWLALTPELSLLGVFIVGLGIANTYPMTLASALQTVPALTDVASARTSIVVGGAVLTVPQLLGLLADQVGLQWAYGVVLVLLAAAILMTFIARFSAPLALTNVSTYHGNKL